MARGKTKTFAQFLLVPIMLSAYFGGFGTGLAAVAICALEASYFLLPPLHSFTTHGIYMVNLVAMMCVGVFSTAIVTSMRLALVRANDLQSVLDEHAIVAITDPTGKMTFVNDKFCAISKYSREELLGKNFRILNSGHHPPGLIQQMWLAISEGKVWHANVKNKAKDGSYYWVDSTIVPLLNERRKLRQYLTIQADITELKDAEEAQLRLVAIVSSSEDAIISKTLEGVITSWNAGAEKTFGYSAGEAVGQSMLMLFPPDRVADEKELLARIGRGESIKHFDTIRIRKYGALVSVSVTLSPIMDSDGKITGVSTIARDITERKHVEDAMETRLLLALEAGGMGTYHLDMTTGSYIDTSIAFKKQLGFAPDDKICPADVARILHPDDRDRIAEDLRWSLENNVDLNTEYRYIWPDGSVHWIASNGRPVYSDTGEPIGRIGVTQDVTERKVAEAALTESEERFRTMANAIPQLAWMAEPDGFIFWYNQRWYEYTATTPEDMEGWGWQSVHDLEVLPQVMEGWTTSIAKGEPYEMEFPLRAGDGTYHPFLTRAYPLKDNDGRIVRWFGTNTDISQIRNAEAQIRELNSDLERRVQERTVQLEAANHELEAFAYSVSHDLRAPLRSIDGFSQALLEDCYDTLSESGRNYLQRVRAASQRMSTLIDAMLALSRVTRADLRRETVDISAVAVMLCDELKAVHPERSVEIDIAQGLRADADVRLLRVVLQNLLGNAWKYSAKSATAKVEVGQTQRHGDSYFFVRDDGSGFNMAYADKLFAPFQRLHSQQEFEGTGIGLATVQRIVLRHGGKIEAESAVGEGATFYFTFSPEIAAL